MRRTLAPYTAQEWKAVQEAIRAAREKARGALTGAEQMKIAYETVRPFREVSEHNQ